MLCEVLTLAASGDAGHEEGALRGSEGNGQRSHDPFLWKAGVWNCALWQPQTSLSHKAPGCYTHNHPSTMAMGVNKKLPSSPLLRGQWVGT